MRRALAFGLTFMVAVAILVGLSTWYKRSRPRLSPASVKPAAPIPQEAATIEKNRRDLLDWNCRTLQEAYDRVGRKDPRWDAPARKAMYLAARSFSKEVDPQVTIDEIFAAAKAAADAGCDDPMLLYLYARASVGANNPGAREGRGRAQVAARGLESSRYPAFRRAVALCLNGGMAISGRNPGAENRKEAERDFDATLALVEESAAGDEHNRYWETIWLNTLIEVTRGYRTLGIPAEEAYERVDAALARVDGLKALRLVYRGNFWLNYGWEARGENFAPAVPSGGFDSLEERLEIARTAFEEAWKLQPGSAEVAGKLVEIDKAVGGDRATMELWFERAMKADGDDRDTCWSKLDWLAPKWHGTAEEMLAFALACRDSKNSRAGITLLVADAYWRIACMPGQNQNEYLSLPEVWADIRSVYDEYLRHHPVDDVARSKYATFCYLSLHYREAEVQYVALGDYLTQWPEFPYVPLGQLKENRERNARIVMGKEGSITFPKWHFVRGTYNAGEWFINIPAGATHHDRPGMIGSDSSDLWTCVADGITYEIRALDVPPALLKQGLGHVLDAARIAVAKECLGQLRNPRDTLLAARPAQEFEVELPGPMQLRVKTIVLGTVLWELSVKGKKDDVMGKAPDEFFASFAFQPKE